jgi:hypothetical protein
MGASTAFAFASSNSRRPGLRDPISIFSGKSQMHGKRQTQWTGLTEWCLSDWAPH